MADWELFDSWTHSGDVSEVDFTGLSSFSEVMVVARDVTKSVSGMFGLRLSVNNGSSYFSGASDYAVVSTAGVETLSGQILLHGTNATAARSSSAIIHAININGTLKPLFLVNAAASLQLGFFIGSTSPVDALRVFPHNGGNFTGGGIYLFAH